MPLVGPRVVFIRSFPTNGIYRVKTFTALWRPTVVAGAQTSPNLTVEIFDPLNRAITMQPVELRAITTPADGEGLNAVIPVNQDYPGGSMFRAVIDGQAGGAPANISITIAGMTGWGSMGGGRGNAYR